MNSEDHSYLEEHAKHLRNVQFFIFILSLILAMSSSMPSKSNLDKALKQLHIIETLHLRVSTELEIGGINENWLSLYARSLHSLDDNLIYEDINSNDIYFEGVILDSKANQYYLYASTYPPYKQRIAKSLIESPLKPESETIGSFRSFWDKLNQIKSVHILKRVGRECLGSEWVNRHKTPQEFKIRKFKVRDRGKDLFKLGKKGIITGPIFFRPYPDRSGDSIAEFINNSKMIGIGLTHVAIGNVLGTNEEICLPLGYREIPINPQDHLRNLFPKLLTSTSIGSFKTSFHELAAYAEKINSIKMENLRVFLENEIKRAGDKQQILGVSFSPKSIRTWGIVLLLCGQFYFLIHLKKFHQYVEFSSIFPKIAWIALYDCWESLLAFTATGIFFPIVAIIMLGFSSRSSNFHIWVSIIGFLLSCYLGWAILKYYRLIKNVVISDS